MGEGVRRISCPQKEKTGILHSGQAILRRQVKGAAQNIPPLEEQKAETSGRGCKQHTSTPGGTWAGTIQEGSQEETSYSVRVEGDRPSRQHNLTRRPWCLQITQPTSPSSTGSLTGSIPRSTTCLCSSRTTGGRASQAPAR